MPENKSFELKWKTYSHILHPYGDLLWHLFWGVILGIFIVLAVINHQFWFLIISLIALIFFFHPKFYEPRLMTIVLNENGVSIDNKFYSWKNFYAYEIFDNQIRKFVFLYPNKFSFGLHFPIEEFFVSEEEIKKILGDLLEERKGGVPLADKIYRSFFL